ncbi:MAG: S8 family serine peptidase [Anaerotardibacter sp.]
MKAYAKKFANIFFSIVLVLGLMPILPYQQAYAVAEADYSEATYSKADGLIVVYNDNALEISEESEGSSLSGNESLEEIGVLNQEEVETKSLTDGSVTVVKVSDDASLKEVASEIESLPEVAYVQPNFEYDLLTTEVSDPFAQGSGDAASNQYYLSSIGAYKAWDYAKANNNVTVAVLDTGVNLKHPDLATNIDIQNAYDITTMTTLSSSGVANNGDANGHGTLVAGVIAAQADNAEGIAGVSYNATILPIKVFDNNNKTTTADLIAAYGYLDELIDLGKTDNLRVINLSLGYYSDTQTESDKALQDAIKTMRNENGVLTVCAGGNSSSNSPCYPSDFDECLSVASLNEDGSLVSGGSGKDIAAYGVNVLSTNASGSYSCASGTSMAAPQVAASAALLWAADSSLSVSEVVSTLTSSSNKDVASVGALDVYAAVSNVLGIDAVDSGDEGGVSNQSEEQSNDVVAESSESGDKANSWRYENGELMQNLGHEATDGSDEIGLFAAEESGTSYATWYKSNGISSYTYRANPTDSNQIISVPDTKTVGIDVSYHNGTIDWAKVKADGIDFAIIRCGYGSNFTSQDDTQFINNVKGALANDIPIGIYLYSYCKNLTGSDSSATSEAEHVLRLLNKAGLSPNDLDLPVFLDLEEKSQAALGTAMLGKIATTFCDKISAAGYEVGIYANGNWWNNYLTDSAFNNSNWHKWVASYPGSGKQTSSKISGTEMWQFSDCGHVDGISGLVDMNFGYGEITTLPENYKVAYRTHVQNIGWQKYACDGTMAGTSGESLRLEGITIDLNDDLPYSGSIEYSTHVQDIGWQGYVSNGELSGTSGQSKRLEAIKIKLTGEIANHYDVYYRVHAQNVGWMGWAKNGEAAGTAGMSYRLEAIQIVLVEKGGSAPGATLNGISQDATECFESC